MAGEGDNDVPSDSALVTAAREGNGAALLALFARYRPALIAFLSGRVGDPGRVEELAQRTFDVAGDRLGTLREPERVGAWLRAIARRQVADDNARRRRLSLDRPLPGGIPPPTAPAIPEQTAVGVEDLLARLDATDRVIVRQYAEGYSVPEIAERLGVSRRIVARRLKAAQERLRILYGKDQRPPGGNPMPRPIRVVAPHHAFTLDELQAFDEDEGALAPERAALIQAHFDEGCLACRSWLANRDELELLAGAVGALPPEGWRGRLVVAWRRTVALERLPVLLLAVPLKALLVRELARRERGWPVRAGAAFGIAGLTLAVLRYVLARPRVIVPPLDGPATASARPEPPVSTHRESPRGPGS